MKVSAGFQSKADWCRFK